jgi:predicted ATPase
VRNEPSSARAVFARRGDYWSISFCGRSFSLKAAKGLEYIQRLLQNPGKEFNCLDLLSQLNAPLNNQEATFESSDFLNIGGPGDAGEMLDAQAKEQYRRRLRELREELEEQRDRGDGERAARTASEIDFLAREIARAVGLGGRDRRAGSAAERARLNATRTIRASIERISAFDSSLGEALTSAIKTGNFCSYTPNASAPLEWSFSIDSADDKPSAADTGPLLPVRQTTFLESAEDRTAFVGREHERSVLRLHLGRALRSERKVVMLGGAPGVGKSRLGTELRLEAARNGFATFAGGCHESEAIAPYGPFVQIIEAAIANSPNLDFVQNSLGNDAAPVALVLPQLRRTFPDIPLPMGTAAELPRPQLFKALIDVLIRLVNHKPLLLLLDDLHWADEGSLALLAHFSRYLSNAPLLIVGTFRNNEWNPDSNFTRLLDELVRTHALETMILDCLPEGAVAEMIRELCGSKPPEDLVAFMYSGTEGNPFFVEELFRHLVEVGHLGADGQFVKQLTLEDLKLPPSLSTVIGRRLARLPEQTQIVLGSAAVLGRAFTFRLLEAATGIDSESLVALVESAERAGLLGSTVQYPEVKFHFSHELIRKSVLESLSPVRLQRLHARAAAAIKLVFGENTDDKINDMAYHLWLSGAVTNASKTLNALSTAAQRAMRQSAYDVAIDNVRRAIPLLNAIEDSSDRESIDLSLHVVLGSSLMATQGYAAPEVEHAFAHARAICQQTTQSSQLAPVLFGLFMFYIVRGECMTAKSLARQLLAIAEERNDTTLLIDANVLLGGTAFYSGRFVEARQHLDSALELIDRNSTTTNELLYGQDRTVLGLSWLALTLWCLGFSQRARQRSEEAKLLAGKISHPFTQVFAHTFDAVLHQLRRDAADVRIAAEKGLRLSTEHQFTLFAACNRMLLAWALKEEGLMKDGIEQTLQGLQEFRATGATLTLPYYSALLAEAYLAANQSAEGLRAITEATDIVSTTGERFYEAEIARLHAELRSSLDPAATAETEGLLSMAMDIARTQEAKSFELRSAISISRLWRTVGRGNEALELLNDTFGWFCEGTVSLDARCAADAISALRRDVSH